MHDVKLVNNLKYHQSETIIMYVSVIGDKLKQSPLILPYNVQKMIIQHQLYSIS